MCVYLLIILCKQVLQHGCKSQGIIPSRGRELILIVGAQDESLDSDGEEITRDQLVDEADVEYRNTYVNFEEEGTLPDLCSYYSNITLALLQERLYMLCN